MPTQRMDDSAKWHIRNAIDELALATTYINDYHLVSEIDAVNTILSDILSEEEVSD